MLSLCKKEALALNNIQLQEKKGTEKEEKKHNHQQQLLETQPEELSGPGCSQNV